MSKLTLSLQLCGARNQIPYELKLSGNVHDVYKSAFVGATQVRVCVADSPIEYVQADWLPGIENDLRTLHKANIELIASLNEQKESGLANDMSRADTPVWTAINVVQSLIRGKNQVGQTVWLDHPPVIAKKPQKYENAMAQEPIYTQVIASPITFISARDEEPIYENN